MLRNSDRRYEVTSARAQGAGAVGAAAIGALAAGAVAVGAIAIGRLAIDRAVIRQLEAGHVHIHSLEVDELTVSVRRDGAGTR
jgi:hydroxymethylpyrimidine/phosphomethylpyrimidine kinase